MKDEWEKNTTWEKFECDAGNRWTQVKGSPFADIHDGDPCYFSGCKEGHLAHKRGETSDGNEAHDWFRDVHRNVRYDRRTQQEG